MRRDPELRRSPRRFRAAAPSGDAAPSSCFLIPSFQRQCMYANPKHIRDREVKVRLDDAAFELLDAMATFSRRQRAVLARELIEEGLKSLFSEAEASSREARG